MKILNTLNSKDNTAEEKLAAVVALVATVRAKYGNDAIEIAPVKVPTTDGFVPINFLNTEERVEIAIMQIKQASLMATATVESEVGTMFDRVFEGFIAVDSILVNLSVETESTY